MTNKKLFTSEQVGSGHPDKLADQVSDIILTSILKGHPTAKVACETMFAGRNLIIAGEVGSNEDSELNAESSILDIIDLFKRYNYGLSYFEPNMLIATQSQDIAQGVDRNDGEIGAGDQGMMFGYATNETDERMPLAWAISTTVLKELESWLRGQKWYKLNFDMKSQTTIDYSTEEPKVHKLLVSCQTMEFDQEKVKKYLMDELLPRVFKKYKIEKGDEYELLFNPTGKFEIGGPVGDTGLTGRKIIADTYGGYGRHGGGAFSGKDGTKVDRSGAYLARYIAKNVREVYGAKEVEVQLSYAIGIAEPTSLNMKIDGAWATTELVEKVRELFPMTPKQIIDYFGLREFDYTRVSSYGHFGNDLDVPWEQLDKVDELKEKSNGN